MPVQQQSRRTAQLQMPVQPAVEFGARLLEQGAGRLPGPPSLPQSQFVCQPLSVIAGFDLSASIAVAIVVLQQACLPAAWSNPARASTQTPGCRRCSRLEKLSCPLASRTAQRPAKKCPCV